MNFRIIILAAVTLLISNEVFAQSISLHCDGANQQFACCCNQSGGEYAFDEPACSNGCYWKPDGPGDDTADNVSVFAECMNDSEGCYNSKSFSKFTNDGLLRGPYE